MPKTLHIAVISDTHNRLPGGVVEQLAGADVIWHLGDVCQPETLEPLRHLGCPLIIIRGNNDFDQNWPVEKRLQFGERRFWLVHIPPRTTRDADVILCGHTHVPMHREENSVIWLNPGSVGLPNKGAPASWAWLDLDPDTGEFSFTLQPVASPSNPPRRRA
jgi:putative phosphoesterase